MYSFNDLFSPLDKKYCYYFYYLSVISYFIFVFATLSFVWSLMFHYNKLNLHITLNLISVIISTFLAYFVNRLMYSICLKSL
jgi:hypothetical protein